MTFRSWLTATVRKLTLLKMWSMCRVRRQRYSPGSAMIQRLEPRLLLTTTYFDAGTLTSGNATFSDAVQNTDEDIYRFQLTADSDMSAAFSGLTKNIKIVLARDLNGNDQIDFGETVETANFISGPAYTMTEPLSTGNYLLKITPTNTIDNTAYTLTLNSNIAPEPPTIAGSGNVLSYTENNPAKAIDVGITVSDVDSATLANATVTITNFVANQDVLSFANDDSTMGTIAGVVNNGVLTLSSSGSPATLTQWQSALRAVRYSNSSENPTTTNRSVDFIVNDGVANSNTATSTISITAVNDVPVAQSGSVTTNEDTAKTFAVSDFQFTDMENDSLVSVTIDGLNLASGDTLKLSGTDVTPNHSILAANIPNLVYVPASNTNGNGLSTFTFKVNDSSLSTAAATMTINVTAVNDVPVAQASSVTTNEDTDRAFAVGDFHFTDVENDALVPEQATRRIWFV